MLRRNTAANFAAQAFITLLQLAVVPIYIHYIGVAGFGLVGLYAVLQAAFNLLDFGMTPTLMREVARYTGGGSDAAQLRNFLRSMEWLALGAFVLVALLFLSFGGAISKAWIQSPDVSAQAVHVAIAVTALVAALRLGEGIYRGCLTGLQDQVRLNAVAVASVLLRAVPTVAVLAFVSPTIEAYFLMQMAMALVSLILFRIVARRRLPDELRHGRFDLGAIRHFGRFAAAMFVTALAGSALVLAEKLTLTKLLSLHDYGLYSLAGLAAGAIMGFVYPITQAWGPRLAQLHGAQEEAEAARTFHRGAAVVTALAGSAAAWLIVFARPVLEIWTRKAEVAAAAAPLLQMLTLASLMTALISMPIQLQIAYRRLRVVVWSEVAALLLVVPAILIVTPRYGAWGAAACIAALQLGVAITLFSVGVLRVLPGARRRWLLVDTIAPLAAASVVALACSIGAQALGAPAWLAAILAPPLVATAAILAVPALRREATETLARLKRLQP